MMDQLSTDIIIHVILPSLPEHALITLQRTSKRFHRLVLSFFPYKLRKHLIILGEICQGGFLNLLRWFIGRGQSDLRWSLLVDSVTNLIRIGNFCYVFRYIL